ncbi:hypothetical protein PIB30_005787 [Stylosanthes scabra]|uniref:Uncharacterized protein n=1 Tax=Stylosanthes scabra TaxID=79078 RepID=A0ABU6X372_9FABA|nr:hypothetical protein [Stylosanthes scabra]
MIQRGASQKRKISLASDHEKLNNTKKQEASIGIEAPKSFAKTSEVFHLLDNCPAILWLQGGFRFCSITAFVAKQDIAPSYCYIQ